MNTFVSILFLIHLNVTFSQNLVPNPSFENYTSCPSGPNQLTYAFPWTAPTNNDAEYFHSCSSNTSFGVPNQDIYNFQYPHSGNAFVGLFLYNGVDNNYREYCSVQLLNTLETNKCYWIQFYINKASGAVGGKYAINNIACAFTNSAITTSGAGEVINFNPNILKFGNPIIKDTLNWISITGIYYALGGENYITIGNFKSDNLTDTLNTGDGTYPGAYYFIDDVSVIEISNLPGGMSAFAGNDATISQLGDSAFLGQEISNLNCNWSILGGAQIATNTSGLFVQPTSTTTYVVEQTLCGTITYDTVTVFVTVGLEELNHSTNFELYPNPTTGKVFVSSSNLTGEELKVSVMDVTGKEVFNTQLSLNEGISHFSLDVKAGSYFVTLLDPVTTKKIIRQLFIQK